MPFKIAALAFAVAVFAASWIQPRWPLEQAMHGSLTVVAFAWLAWHLHRRPMRSVDVALICGFLALHSLGARWLYTNVPYDAWLQAATGWSPAAAFGWQRNHFDRLVHLAYGLCFTTALHVWLRQRWPALTPGPAYVLAVLLVMCTSLVYEWAEWVVALTLSPEAAESYNGQQGDVWDAHMDMFLATLGALFAWPLRARRMPAR